MKRHLRLVCAALLTIAAAAPVRSAPQPVPADTVVTAPAWSVGSTWYYSDGYGLKVSSSANGTTVFERLDAPGQWFSRQGFLRKDLVSGTATRNSIYRTLADDLGASLVARAPLTFQREYLSNGKLVVHSSSWTLEGRETITVPAGTFDCWVIVWRTRSVKSDWTGFERWWYSPAAQNYVRMEYKYGAAEASSRVLMRYTLGQRAELQLPEKLAIVTTAPPPPALMASEAPRELAPALPAPEIPLPATEAAAPEIPLPPAPVDTPEPALPVQQASLPSPAEPQAAKAEKKASPPPDASVQSGHVWRVQLASSKDEAALRADFDKLRAVNAARLDGVPSGVSSARIAGRGVFYRAWVGAFASAREAAKLCSDLKTKGGCAVMRVRPVNRPPAPPADKARPPETG